MQKDGWVPDEIEGVYRLREKVGHGGMAVVYRAEVDLDRFDYTTLYAYTQVQGATHSERRGRAEELAAGLRAKELDTGTVRSILEAQGIPVPAATVAIKICKPQVDRERFEGEWKNLLCLNHDNVVKVYGGGVADGRPYYAMELLTGTVPAEEIIETFDLRQKVAVVLRAAAGLGYLHDNALIHRDIKPDNMLTCRDESGGYTTKIMDLGLGKSLDTESSMTLTGSVLGSPSYMSPEQVTSSRTVDHRSDIYSLGASLYELASGYRPYHDKQTPFELIAGVVQHEKPIPVREHAPRLPEDLVRIIERAMAFAPEDRYQSVGEMAADLASFHGGSEAAAAMPTAMMDPSARPASGARVPAGPTVRMSGTAARSAAVPTPATESSVPAVPQRRSAGRWALVLALLMVLGGLAAGGWWYREDRARRREWEDWRAASAVAADCGTDHARGIAALDGYLRHHADGPHADRAHELRAALDERRQRRERFRAALAEEDPVARLAALRALAAAHPDAPFADELREAIADAADAVEAATDAADWAAARSAAEGAGDDAAAAIAAYTAYLEARPEGAHTAAAREAIAAARALQTEAQRRRDDDAAWAAARDAAAAAGDDYPRADAAYRRYLDAHPRGRHVDAARAARAAVAREWVEPAVERLLAEEWRPGTPGARRPYAAALRLAGAEETDPAAVQAELAAARAAASSDERATIDRVRLYFHLRAMRRLRDAGDWRACLAVAIAAARDFPERRRPAAIRRAAEDGFRRQVRRDFAAGRYEACLAALTDPPVDDPELVELAGRARAKLIEGLRTTVGAYDPSARAPNADELAAAERLAALGDEDERRRLAAAAERWRRFPPLAARLDAWVAGEEELADGQAAEFLDAARELGLAAPERLAGWREHLERQRAATARRLFGSALRWAERRGRDGYGPWAAITIAGQELRLRRLPPGSFPMGSPPDETGRDADERRHRVTLTGTCWLAETETTQALWQAVMRSNPSSHRGEGLPVEDVTWQHCRRFIDRVNRDLAGIRVRLPTEAEWEYACRAGTETAFSWGDAYREGRANLANDPENESADKQVAYFRRRGLPVGGTLPVGSFDPNPWGFYDMHGNVWEWCRDWYGRDYPREPAIDPTGPAAGTNRVFRGGSWDRPAAECRSANRGCFSLGFDFKLVGFRLAVEAVEE